MKIGILGTGTVGQVIGSKLISLGHEVKMGSRSHNNEKAAAWVIANGNNASQGTFGDAAAFGEIIFNCTKGMVSLEALRLAGKENLAGKILIDLSNPLDFSKGMPPILVPELQNTWSLAEAIQQEFPETRVVKTLNTMNVNLMVNPSLLSGEHVVFLSGNDAGAKEQVSTLLSWFGWKQPIDLGDISTARGTEQLLPLWIRLYGNFGHANFNFNIVK